MQFRHAKKLHSGDEVSVIDIEECVTVIQTHIVDDAARKVVLIDAMTSRGFKQFSHLDVR